LLGRLLSVIGVDMSRPAIRLVDVGARWGANPPWDQLGDGVVDYLGFEPDEEECARLRAANSPRRIEYVPIGLSDRAEQQTLHLTREPGCSTAFPPNRLLLQRFFQSERWDVQRSTTINTLPLATVLSERGFVPDVLKIDVQGAALKVLRGAGDSLDDVLVVDVETEFSQMYDGGALFGDVDALLRARGFELLDLNKYYARRRILDIGHSSRGQVMFADALYVKSVDAFYARHSGDDAKNRLHCLILVMALYGHFDVALEFALDPRSPLSAERQEQLRSEIQHATRIGRWRFLASGPLLEKAGLLLALAGNALRMQSRRLGWGSDLEAVDTRYKYSFRHPILRMFRK
jgi:FkbM family methyltransferase